MRRLGLLASVVVLAWSGESSGASALAAVAPELAHDLGAIPANTVVVAAPLASDVPAPKGEELAARVASLVAGKLGATAHAHPQSAPLSVARAVAAKGGALVYVQAEVAHGALRVTADLYPVQSNGWDRVRVPTPPPRAHAFASAPVDAEIRSFLAPIVLEQARVSKSKHGLGVVLAAACGDIDGDGGMDLALATREQIAWGHLRKGVFVAAHAAGWRALAARVPVPLREPIATLVVPTRGPATAAFFAGSTDRGGVGLGADLLAAAPLPGLPLATAQGVRCATPDPSASALVSPLLDCVKGAGARSSLEMPVPRFDAAAGAEIIGRDGKSRDLVAAREPGGKLTVRLGDATLSVDAAGAALVAADLDQDGVPEIVTSADSGDDAVTVSSWVGSELKPRLKLPAPAGVRALALCPPEEGASPALVAVVGEEVWVVR